jgi:hypothetical protein
MAAELGSVGSALARAIVERHIRCGDKILAATPIRPSLAHDKVRRRGGHEGRIRELSGGHFVWQESCMYPRLRAEDMRGSLEVSEFGSSLPFVPQRIFIVYRVPSAEVRGEHAHRVCHQFMVCVSGSASFLVDENGADRAQVTLNEPGLGLYMPPTLWGTQYGYSSDAAPIVLASLRCDSADYIWDYDEFLRLKRPSATPADRAGSSSPA